MIKLHSSIFCYFLGARIVLIMYRFLHIFMYNGPCIFLTKSIDKFTGKDSSRFGSLVFGKCITIFHKSLSPLFVPYLDKTQFCPILKLSPTSKKITNAYTFTVTSFCLPNTLPPRTRKDSIFWFILFNFNSALDHLHESSPSTFLTHC